MTPEDPILEHLKKANDLLNTIAHASDEHLTYEQMEAWVEDAMDQTEREFVVAHTALCPFCRKQLTAYETYAPVMSAPIAAPARLVPFWERFRSALASMPAAPKFAMAALAVAVIALAPTVIRNARSSSSISFEQIEALPISVRQAAREVVNAPGPIRPGALQDLAPNPDLLVEYPVSEVVEETQPTLKWKALPDGGAYTISIMDSSNHPLAHAILADKTEWVVPVALSRGGKYTWEVAAMGSGAAQPNGSHQAQFRVLGESEDQTLAQLRASGAGPLALGAVEQEFGMLTAAEGEFEKLAQLAQETGPAGPSANQRSQASKLLDHVRSLRAPK